MNWIFIGLLVFLFITTVLQFINNYVSVWLVNKIFNAMSKDEEE